MRIAITIVLALIAIVLAVVAIGAMLPVGHRASRQITIAQPRPKVFALLNDPARFPSWRSKLKSVDTLPPLNGQRAFREHGSDGDILFAVDSVVPDSLLVTRIADAKLPFGGKWTYQLSGDSPTTLRITEDGEVYNPIFRFVSRLVIGHTATIDRVLGDVARHFGEQPRIDDGS